MKLQQSVLEVQLAPLTILLRSVLDQLQEKDQAKVFAQPVSLQEVRLPHTKISPAAVFKMAKDRS